MSKRINLWSDIIITISSYLYFKEEIEHVYNYRPPIALISKQYNNAFTNWWEILKKMDHFFQLYKSVFNFDELNESSTKWVLQWIPRQSLYLNDKAPLIRDLAYIRTRVVSILTQ